MTLADDDQTRSESPPHFQHGKLLPHPESERARSGAQSGRSDSPPPRKRARSPSYERDRKRDCDRWASTATNRSHEPPAARRERSTSPARRDYGHRPSPEASDSRRSLPVRPSPLPSRPGSQLRPSSLERPEIKVSWAVDAMPTRNRNGCIVMVEYDHLLVQHLQAGHRVDSFDVRKLRHRPTLSPRERWLRVQNHLLTYDVIDESLIIPTRPAGPRRSPSPRDSPSNSKRDHAPTPESSASQLSVSPGTVNVAHSIPSSLSPSRSAGEISPTGAAAGSISKIAIDAVSVEPSAAATGVEASGRTPSPAAERLQPITEINAPLLDCAAPALARTSTLSQSNETAADAAIADLEALPCSVVSSPPPSSQPPSKPSSSSPASTTTDPKGDPRTLALFDEAIYLCGRFCDLVEEDRKKRRGAAEARGEGGGA